MLMLSSIRLSETPWLIPCLQYLNKTILSYHTHTHTDIYIYIYIYIYHFLEQKLYIIETLTKKLSIK